ncbi:poly(R)-hydroxyalkanoic acid synthase subunit PhaE [Luteimonas sp. TWI1416]|uniref:poly(R)-hydroxyalkanoic acid synthase subunit PhaE n=1 Tax=unclassified Luteimonas TaxID=2629088 RepID=UPI00320801D8
MANSAWDPAAPGEELERLARRYWDAWQAALQRTMPGAAPGFPNDAAARPTAPWQAMFEAWMPSSPSGKAGIEDVLQRFNRQAGDWWTRMQRVAEGFAGQQPSPETVARTWRDALGGDAANPFAQMFGGLGGTGVEGWDGWLRALQPLVDALRGDGSADGPWPALGPLREHQLRWQALLHAFAEYPRTQQAYQGLLLQASQAAFARFERRLSNLDAEAVTIESPRALFDLWVEAAEEAYAEVALSPGFRSAYAQMVAGQMRLRQALQREVEQACRLLDLPTRSELDGAHRKIADLERTVRRMRDRLDDVEAARTAPSAGSSQEPEKPARPSRAPKKAAAKTAPRQAARKTAAAQRPGAKRAPAKRAAKAKHLSATIPQAPAPLTSAKPRTRKR